MKTTFYLLVAVLALFGTAACNSIEQDDERMKELLSACQTTDPMTELQWLADLDAKYEQQSHMYRIRVVEFEGNSYILFDDWLSSSPMSNIFECTGENAFNTTLAGVHYNDLMKGIQTVKVLKSKNWPKD